MAGIQIGQLLVEQGVLSAAQVDHILTVQRHSGRPFGDLAERLYGVSARAVEDAWVQQYVRTAGIADLSQLSLDEQCLRLLSRRQAWQFHLLPMFRDFDSLNVATDEHNLVRAVNFATRRLREPVYFHIAQSEQLREFLMRHYPVAQEIADYAQTLGR